MIAAAAALVVAVSGLVGALTAAVKVWFDHHPRDAPSGPAPIAQGMTVQVAGWQELAAERDQHSRCDVLLAQHGIPLPHE